MKRYYLIIITCIIASLYVNYRGGWNYIEKKYDEFYMMLKKPQDKIWLHRVNSPIKVKDKLGDYKGAELDVIFHDELNAFENSHDPSDSFDKHRLSDTLQAIAAQKVPSLWIDFKNLTSENATQAQKVLGALMDQYGFKKSNVIVESRNIQALSVFHHAGFKTSYYFPWGISPKDFKTGGKGDEIMKRFLKQPGIDFVSFDDEYYPFIQRYCDGKNFQMLTWMIDVPNWVAAVRSPKHKTIIDDARVAVVLCKDTAHTVNH